MVYLKNVSLIFLLTLLFSCGEGVKKTDSGADEKSEITKKRILYIDSYHEDYLPGTKTRKAFLKNLPPGKYEVKFTYLNARRKPDKVSLEKNARYIKFIADYWSPDLLIAADDPASEHVIRPFFYGGTMPVIFTGVDWDASRYGYPTENITGQIEVELIGELTELLMSYTKGKRVGILMSSTPSDRTGYLYYEEILKEYQLIPVFTENFLQWKQAFIRLQQEADLIILKSNTGIKEWKELEAIDFAMEESIVPTGTLSESLKNISLVSYANRNEGFGEYSGAMAEKLLSGAVPGTFAVTKNRESKIFLNMPLSRKMNILFPEELLDRSLLITSKEKILYVNSYHKGYDWSDGIEKGLISALGRDDSGKTEYILDDYLLRIYRMDTKRNSNEEYIKNEALSITEIISRWKPDILITSDDNAAKYLISPYYTNSDLPVIFCGLNWDASIYGFPTKNITGMVEVAPVKNLIEMLKTYAGGTRIGYLGADNLSENKEVYHYINTLNIEFTEGALVKTFEEWKKNYVKLQKSCDMVILVNYTGINNWNDEEAREFLLQETHVPTGSTSSTMQSYVAVSMARVPEEQGWWAGKQALRVLKGTSPRDIAPATNKNSNLILNMTLCKKLNMIFDAETIDNAVIVEMK